MGGSGLTGVIIGEAASDDSDCKGTGDFGCDFLVFVVGLAGETMSDHMLSKRRETELLTLIRFNTSSEEGSLCNNLSNFDMQSFLKLSLFVTGLFCDSFELKRNSSFCERSQSMIVRLPTPLCNPFPRLTCFFTSSAGASFV